MVGVILFLFSGLFSLILYQYLKAQVIKDAREKTVVIMTQLKALGGFVKERLRPKLFELIDQKKMDDHFIIEAMSTTHVRNEVMRRFNKELPDYTYKRVSDRPLNPRQLAEGIHRDMIEHFRKNPAASSWSGQIKEGKQHYIMYVLPVVSDGSCLACHGDRARAPKALVARYGETGFFDWKENTVVGVESVAVPLTVALTHIRQITIDTFVFGTATLAVLFIALTGTFKYLVTMPLNRLSAVFTGIARGEEPLGKKIPSDRADEIGTLTTSFNLLATHLLEAQERLKHTAAIEKQLRETEKLASLGQLSAGVAHEINNPLGGMKLCFNNLVRGAMDGEKRRQHVEVINSGFDRIQKIVRNLLDFSKNSSLSVAPVSLNYLVESVLNLTEYTIGKKGILLVKRLSPDCPDLMADANKLEQVLLNLIINALQAMEPGGVLTISTWVEGNSCRLSVSDTGKGIAADIVSRIFDPFFTTKGVEEGTGLGLTVSKAIIEQHKGRIAVTTSPQGTSFTVELPLAP